MIFGHGGQMNEGGRDFGHCPDIPDEFLVSANSVADRAPLWIQEIYKDIKD